MSDIKEFRLQVLGKVEVTEILITLHHVGQFVVLPAHSAVGQVVSEANRNLSNVDEVHLSHFLFFFVDQVFFHVSQKLAGFETKGHFVKELAVFRCRQVLTFAFRDGTEEISKVVEHIIE